MYPLAALRATKEALESNGADSVSGCTLNKHFGELEAAVDGFADPTGIAFAVMEIRLHLDEIGADFMSAGEMGVVGEFGDDEYDAHRIRRFVFDKPFFVAFKEPAAEAPYFMAWIANDELMEPFSE